MSKKEKIVKRLLSRPVDFSFAELATLLGLFGYSLSEAGKTSGSRVVFIKGSDYIRLHKPHPGNILKRYQIDDIYSSFTRKRYGMSNYLHYKGYIGSVEFSEEDNVFHGKVIGIKPLISFEGDTVTTIKEDFYHSVDEYLEFCIRSGIQPEKPYKGSFNVRIGADLHRRAAFLAHARGVSLNMLVEDAIRQSVDLL